MAQTSDHSFIFIDAFMLLILSVDFLLVSLNLEQFNRF